LRSEIGTHTDSTGPETHCNNDHGLSPDGSLLAISDQSAADGRSRIYVLRRPEERRDK